MTIVEFLRARYDEDEHAARRAGADNPVWLYERERFEVAAVGGWSIASRRAAGPLCDVDGEHIARHDPARVLREVEAKRRIVDRAELVLNAGPDDLDPASLSSGKILAIPAARQEQRLVLRLLALPYSDHPDFDPSWRV